MNLFGFEVEVLFLITDSKIVAYAWHYDVERAKKHLERIKKFHSLHGKIVKSEELENWLGERLYEVVIEGSTFTLPHVDYRYREVYEELLKIPKGSTMLYSELARKTGVRYQEVIGALMKNPLQVLIPCHRLLTKRGTLMGFYPLGKDVKKRLLELEIRDPGDSEIH